MNRLTGLSIRVYRMLLLTYPAAFRRRFGEEMVQVFRDCCRDALSAQGSGGVVLLWLHTLPDLMLTAVKERLIEAGYTGAKQMDTNLVLNRQIVSMFELMSRALRSGYSVKQCLEIIARHAPEPAAGAVRKVVAEMEQGTDSGLALTGFKTALNSPYMSQLIDIMLNQRREGGNLADKLDTALKDISPQTGHDAWLEEAIKQEGIGKS